KYSNQDFIRAVKQAKDTGLHVTTLNMIGLPYETLADFKQTIIVNRTALPTRANLYNFFPYPGTDLFKLSKEKKFLPQNLDSRMEWYTPNLNLPEFPKKLIRKEFEWFQYNIYRSCKPLFLLLLQVFFWKVHTRPRLYHIYQAFLGVSLINNLMRKLLRTIGVTFNVILGEYKE
ncbi:MAG: hypothetical protein ACFFBD_13550, partial [Candidatus Hodarchaeota archaeon]